MLGVDRAIRILIADDEDGPALLSRLIVESEDRFQAVGRARNGDEAVTLADALAADVVLMDLEMPVLDGFGALRRLRENGSSPAVVIVSGSDLPGDVEKAIAEGAVGFVRKPPSHEELLDAIWRAAETLPHTHPSAA